MSPPAVGRVGRRSSFLGQRCASTFQTRRYVYDGEDVLLEYDGTNTLQARYTHGPGIDEPLAVTKGRSTFFYHQDGLGSVTDLTDSAGVTAKSYSYDAYGNILESPGTVDQPYTYTGREFDSETGLSYYRARYYEPRIGRFPVKDPIGFKGGDTNLYGYVRQNPANRLDPWGLAETYCGSGRKKAFIPDSWWGQYSFAKACKNHDECYDRCFSSKSGCDLQFIDDMTSECKKLAGYWANDCYTTASVYFRAVQRFGDAPFKDSQDKCYCPSRIARQLQLGELRSPLLY